MGNSIFEIPKSSLHMISRKSEERSEVRPVEALMKDWTASFEPLAPACFDFVYGEKKRETEETNLRFSERERWGGR